VGFGGGGSVEEGYHGVLTGVIRACVLSGQVGWQYGKAFASIVEHLLRQGSPVTGNWLTTMPSHFQKSSFCSSRISSSFLSRPIEGLAGEAVTVPNGNQAAVGGDQGRDGVEIGSSVAVIRYRSARNCHPDLEQFTQFSESCMRGFSLCWQLRQLPEPPA